MSVRIKCNLATETDGTKIVRHTRDMRIDHCAIDILFSIQIKLWSREKSSNYIGIDNSRIK